MIRHTRRLFARRRIIALLIIAFHASSRNAYAQLDPLLALKTQQPTVLLLVDTSSRMQRDADETYYDPQRYTRSTATADAAWQAGIGVTASTASQFYYRKFINLQAPPPLLLGAKYQADKVETVGDLQEGYSTFLAKTRIEIAKQGLLQLVEGNMVSTRFGLLRLGQVASASNFQTTSPVYSNLASQHAPSATETAATPLVGPPEGWKITRNTNLVTGSSLSSVISPLIPTSTANNNVVRDAIANSTGTTGALVPLGLGDLTQVITPIAALLQSVISALLQWLTGAPVCQNVAIVLVVGGGEPLSLSTILVTVTQIVGLIFGHRIPVHVVSIAAPTSDLSFLQSIADMTGGRFTNVTKAQIDATTPGQPVPEVAEALNWAVQHAFLAPSEFNGAASASALRNLTNEHQTTSPITGTVNLRYRADITGTLLPNTYITNQSGTEIPQRSNVMVTSGYALPGFDGKLRAFRVYKPVADVTKPGGYRFSQDGTRLWVATAPAAASRNIFTVLPNGTMTAFSAENASTLAQYLGPVDAADLIQRIRSQPIGAIVGSTPAVMDPPSLDPPPDPDYAFFKDLNRNRRSIVFVGANDGMMHAIDARTGLEVWAFIPFNLLPKLRTVTWGHGLDAGFRYMVDSSPKLSDVKVDGEWRTHLYFGEAGGGTFYNALDVTLHRMDDTLEPTNDSTDALLTYFALPTRIPWVWSFPKLTSFDPTIAPYGDVSAAASALEKSVGESWSDPAVGRMGTADGEYGVFVGSGFLTYTKQQQSNRGGAVAGGTFYVLDAGTGDVLASRDVGSDSIAENVDNCRAAGNCMQSKNALQMDPVATGPYNTRHITKIYIGDLDGRVWRMNVTVGASGAVTLSTPTKLYDAGKEHALYGSMAAVNVGANQTYLFFGTGSDLLPSTGVNINYYIRILLDTGASTGSLTFSQALTKTDNSGDEEKMTGFPAVAGDIVFFTTTTQKTTTPCTPFDSNLYAFTFTGGPAYDTNNDGQLKTTGSKKDSVLLLTRTNARVTSPFIVDQHLYFGSGNKVEVFGDPNDFNNGVGQAGVRVLSWREVR